MKKEIVLPPFEPGKKYGVMVSGGLDSAVLLYLLIKKLHNGNNIQPFVIPKFDVSEVFANGVIDYYNKMLLINLPNPIRVGNPELFHRDMSRSAVKEILDFHECDTIFNGLNRVPDVLVNEHSPVRETQEYERIKFPFLEYLKTDIISIMFEHKLDKLMDITHTCTESIDVRCGKCWQCQERKWAFDQLGILDTGTF